MEELKSRKVISGSLEVAKESKPFPLSFAAQASSKLTKGPLPFVSNLTLLRLPSFGQTVQRLILRQITH